MTKTQLSARLLRMPIGWRARVFLEERIGMTYPWVAEQVERMRERASA